MEKDIYSGLEPAELWRHFAALNRIPRGSGKEAEARDYVRAVAEAAGAEFSVDERGNALVRATSRLGGEGRAPVAVQAHLDMVCVAAAGVEHDFDRDPIAARRDGDRVFAKGTTLGADNGIGVAAALALLTDPDVSRGPLELLFTVEEEIGLLGALHFDTSLLQARTLINLDSEDDKALTVGCAGGVEIGLWVEVGREDLGGGWSFAELDVSGLSGGHSGVQIHERRANAAKLLVNLLDHAIDAGIDTRLTRMEAGSAHNAIPASGTARLAVPIESTGDFETAVQVATEELMREWRTSEPGIAIELRRLETPAAAFARSATASLLGLLRELPHGVLAMSPRFEGTVATSVNMALVRTGDSSVEVLSSIRSLSAAELDATVERVKQLGEEAGAGNEVQGAYPGWEPRERSPLAASATAAYERIHGSRPAIEVVHGGLECGVLVAAEPTIDAISFGPLIREAHTPQEHVYASTVKTTWELLLALLNDVR